MKFHDVNLSTSVDNALQALAVDKHRKPFTPAIWQQQPGAAQVRQRLEQVWFAGVHSDVGGGYPEAALSDLALRWMAGRATECALAFANIELAPDAQGTMHDSMTWYYRLFGEQVHPMPVQRYENEGRPVVTEQRAVDSAIERLRNPSYQPPNLIAFHQAGGPQVEV
jgi:hypothetical protein